MYFYKKIKNNLQMLFRNLENVPSITFENPIWLANMSFLQTQKIQIIWVIFQVISMEISFFFLKFHQHIISRNK